MGSHSVAHESLGNVDKSPLNLYPSLSKVSSTCSGREGFRSGDFRAPYLSIEPTYRRRPFENESGCLDLRQFRPVSKGNLVPFSSSRSSFPENVPIGLEDVWELPLSCFDDFLLFEKLKKPTAFVSIYWKKKLDIEPTRPSLFSAPHPSPMSS